VKKILIINGNPRSENVAFDDFCVRLKESLIGRGNEVAEIMLRNKRIKDCIGCYSCWVATPGKCALKDDQEEILKAFVNMDLVILASPLIMGFISADLKKINDRMIPLAHPFLRLADNRMAHYPRYDKIAKMGLIIEKDQYYDDNVMKIINKIYSYASFVKFIDNNAEEIADEAYNL